MTDTSSRPNSKVARVIEAYDLAGLGAQLERQWTGADGDRTSLRDLADVFNRRVLEAA
ncbi:rod-determining factor RdfA, partial [Halorubrum pallidum]